jgi:hypothetical protein
MLLLLLLHTGDWENDFTNTNSGNTSNNNRSSATGYGCHQPSSECVESLISVNHKLGLRQAAAGILRHAQVGTTV